MRNFNSRIRFGILDRFKIAPLWTRPLLFVTCAPAFSLLILLRHKAEHGVTIIRTLKMPKPGLLLKVPIVALDTPVPLDAINRTMELAAHATPIFSRAIPGLVLKPISSGKPALRRRLASLDKGLPPPSRRSCSAQQTHRRPQRAGGEEANRNAIITAAYGIYRTLGCPSDANVRSACRWDSLAPCSRLRG